MEKYINSSNIEKLSWSKCTLRLFYTNGQIVAYNDVPEGIAVGMAQAPSSGSYMRLYICGVYSYEIERQSDINHTNAKLEHHKDTTVGLFATDRPDLIPEELKSLFFQINYNEIA